MAQLPRFFCFAGLWLEQNLQRKSLRCEDAQLCTIDRIACSTALLSEMPSACASWEIWR